MNNFAAPTNNPQQPPALSLQSGKARVHFVLIGGFLGAGKTSAMTALADFLLKSGKRVGIVTNDQAGGLVDSRSVQSSGGKAVRSKKKGPQEQQGAVTTREVTGGCFCCKADELVGVLKEMELSRKPELFLAEPVGSCTDLMATVLLPLRRIYGKEFTVAPMCVLVDAVRLAGIYGISSRSALAPMAGSVDADRGRSDHNIRSVGAPDTMGSKKGFSKEVRYIYLKQLEEAEILVLNKVDLLSAEERVALREKVQELYGKRVLEVSTLTGEGMAEWFKILTSEVSAPKRLMEMDYEEYADGEAMLGWYNATLALNAVKGPVDGNKLLLNWALAIQADLEAVGAEIAHFKMSLGCGMAAPPISRAGLPANKSADVKEVVLADGRDAHVTLAVVNAVRNGTAAALSRKLKWKVAAGELLVNLRAEAEPALLETIVRKHLVSGNASVRLTWVEQAAFKPGKPQPTHRVTEL